MRIAVATDAWYPQVNGVVRTLEETGRHLEAMGHEVLFVTPDAFRTVPCPTYPSIRLAVLPGPGVAEMLERSRPKAVHIATEGPIGHATRAFCLRNGFPFTTSFHTQFPEYIRARVPVPLAWSYRYLRRFHAPAVRTMVPTQSQRERLLGRGFQNLVVWSRGVDTELFHPRAKDALDGLRPRAIYVGRVAVEKNIEAFVSLDLPGSKYVIGEGPDLDKLRRRYPDVRFVGQKLGEELATYMAAADVFVFPSRTDTYGLVLLEAMASGVPVAAYPVTGPIDVVIPGVTGVLDEDLRNAVRGALELRAENCVAFARRRSWRRCTQDFFSFLAPREAQDS